MHRKQTVLVCKCAAILCAPVIVWAFSTGPNAHLTAVPETGEQSCVACHAGTDLNGGGGNVAISTASGNTYTPGEQQTITITITDAAAQVYGFEMTARLASDRSHSTGTFTPGAGQRVLCASTSTDDTGQQRSGDTCEDSRPVEFIEHSQPSTSNTITVQWTAPSSDVGAIELYVSANAANNDRAPTGDHIYHASLTLQPAAGNACGVAGAPSIKEGGIVNAGDFGAAPGVAPGSWIEIYGENLAGEQREWALEDFDGDTAPQGLGGVSVTIGGKPAFLRFISSGQINAQVPDDIGTGPVPVVVTNCGGSSPQLTVNAAETLPGLLAPPQFKVNEQQYVFAQFSDGTFVGDPEELPGTNRPVKPGETITFYGIGFGPVTPAVAAGSIASGETHIEGELRIRFGEIEATEVSYAGLAPGSVGLYQFNVKVPENTPDGDQPVTFTLNGVELPQTMVIEVQQ